MKAGIVNLDLALAEVSDIETVAIAVIRDGEAFVHRACAEVVDGKCRRRPVGQVPPRDGTIFGGEEENRIAKLRGGRAERRVLRIDDRPGRRGFTRYTRRRRNCYEGQLRRYGPVVVVERGSTAIVIGNPNESAGSKRDPPGINQMSVLGGAFRALQGCQVGLLIEWLRSLLRQGRQCESEGDDTRGNDASGFHLTDFFLTNYVGCLRAEYPAPETLVDDR